jgi:hypothetical protein
MSLLDDARTLFRRIERRQQPLAPPPDEDDEAARSKLERYETEFIARVLRISDALVEGNYSASEWMALVEIEIRYLHLVAAALGKGGFGALTLDDLNRVQRIVGNEFNYLTRWAHTLTRPARLNTKQIRGRIQLYAGAARETYSTFFMLALRMPELPFQPTQTECQRNCRCHWRIVRVGAADWDAYWERHKGDSCKTCVARGLACYPLRIRNGIIQPFDATGTLV